MILKRLLPSNWRKDPPAVEPTADLDTLAQQATGNADPGARRQACKQITDLGLLSRIAEEDADAGVRAFVAARLRTVLAGGDTNPLDLQTRLTYLQSDSNPLIATYLLGKGKETQIREAALPRVTDQEALADCAMGDSVASLRLQAVQMLDERSALERVARLMRKKDKNVYRHARQKLKEITEREQEPLRIRTAAEELCARTEALGRRETWAQDRALLEHLDKQWTGLGEAIPEELRQRFQQAKDTFETGYGAYREANKARLEEEEARARLQESKRNLLTTLESLKQDDYLRETATRFDDLCTQWKALAALPDKQERPLQKEFQTLAEDLQGRLERQHALNERKERLAVMQKEAVGWLEHSSPLDRKQVQRWTSQGRKLADLQPEDSPARGFEETRSRLQERLDKQVQHAQDKLQHIPERLALLEAELDEGVLRKASSLHQSIHADLELVRHSGVERHHYSELEQHYKQLTPRLRELQNWRKWGTDQHREELCERMAQLETVELPLEELTEQVQALQAEWKNLDSGGSPVNEKLWKRFHGSADKAYERCRPFLDQQAEEKAANRQSRADLCQQLETFLEQVDWERVDWKKAVHAERDIRTAWGNIGPVEPRHRKALDKRYRGAMKKLDSHLSEERLRNREYKKGLIEQARQLVESEDTDQAIRDIKRLQKEWYTTVPSKRKQENHLWQEFRAACDNIFERRRETQQAHRKQLDGHIHEAKALCAELETLSRDDSTDPEDLLHRAHKLQGRWREASSQPIPRAEAAKLDKRWSSGLDAVQAQAARLGRHAERAQLDLMRAQAALCSELEGTVENTDTAQDAAPWQDRWDALPTAANPRDTQSMQQRFEQALHALTKPDAHWAERFTDNLAQRRDLCLHLEVLAGIESPPEAAQERLAFQVSRLSERLGQGEADPLNEAPRIERAWYQSGAVSCSVAADLEARFDRARQVFLEQGTVPAGGLQTAAEN